MIYSHIAKKPRLTLEARDCDTQTAEDRVIEQARDILMRRMAKTKYESLSSPLAVRGYLQLTIGTLEHEEFWCIFLDTRHRVIAAESLFTGTLSQTSVYPREVVKRALAHNAGAVIFAHNHPSGLAEPSGADELLTRTLKSTLALIDVQVLDHFIIAGASALSFAERGLL